MSDSTFLTHSPFLTIAEASRFLRISERTCYVLAERGQMPTVKVGGQYRVPVDALNEWLGKSRRGDA